jgi:hypothetical protein
MKMAVLPLGLLTTFFVLMLVFMIMLILSMSCRLFTLDHDLDIITRRIHAVAMI